MKTLIVHDRCDVATELCTIVQAVLGPNTHIDVAEDYHSAYEFLNSSIYDLLIVDLTIPFRKGDAHPDFKAVEQLLKEIFSYDTLNIPGDVIGITYDISALNLVKTSLGPHLMVTIEEDSEGLWKTYLRDKINYANRAAKTRSININQHYDYDALIVTAMDKEMHPYKECFELQDEIKHFPGATEFLFNDKDGVMRKGIAYSIGRSGQPSAASLSQALISTFRPKIALMSGYCGGVKTKVKLGDLIFFEAAYAWDYGKWSEESNGFLRKKHIFSARPDPISISGMKTHRVARHIVQKYSGKIPEFDESIKKLSKGKLSSISHYLKPAGSGSAVVANDKIIAQIRGLNESIWAVDMECYGFYHAAENTTVVRPQFICVKAVSDFCNGEKGDDFHEACCQISAAAVHEILTQHWNFDEGNNA